MEDKTKDTYLAIDEQNNKLSFLQNGKLQAIFFNQIIDVKLTIDEETKSSKGCGGAILSGIICSILGLTLMPGIPGLLFGALVGLILGGIFSSSKQKVKINNIKLRITIEGYSHSLVVVPFDYLSHAEEWEGKIKSIIQRVKAQNQKNLGENIVADELKKLHKLMVEGVISEDEFQLQKAKLISKN